jgi:hypothetical protein
MSPWRKKNRLFAPAAPWLCAATILGVVLLAFLHSG